MTEKKGPEHLAVQVLKAFQISSDPRVQLSRASRALASALGADRFLLYARGVESGVFLIRGTAGLPGEASLDPNLEGLLLKITLGESPVLWAAGAGEDCPLPAYAAGGMNRAAAVPLRWRGRPVGVAAAGFGDSDAPVSDLVGELQDIADTLSALVRGGLSRYYQTRKNELAGELLRLSEDLSRVPDARSCLASVTREAARLTGSRGAVLRVWEKGRLKVRSFYCADPLNSGRKGDSAAEEAARRAFAKKSTVTVDPGPGDGPWETGAGRSLLCFPFEDLEGQRGVLTVMDRLSEGHPAPYTRLERETLRALLRVGGVALHHIEKENEVRRMSRSLEKRVRELGLLHRISRAVLDRRELKEVLRSLLMSVTDAEGLGFDRAFLFLHEEDERVLKGFIGVEALARGDGAPEEEPMDPGGSRHRNLDGLVERLTLPVCREGGVLSRTVLDRRSFRIRSAGDRDLVSEEVSRTLGDVTSFATIPLVSENRVLGVLWVDNLRTFRPIETEEYRILASAAVQAGLAVERYIRARALEDLNTQIMELQNRLIQWEKMAALGEMAASVAHDIRNPLVSICGFTRRLRKLIPDSERGRRYADIIIAEVDRLERILDDLMTYARGYRAHERATVALHDLLSECAELFRENFKRKRVTLVKDLDGALEPLVLDERQIKQAVINILFNAGEAVPEEGSVLVSLRETDSEKGPMVVITVADSGPGIDPDHLEKIFNPFFTTKATGTGLGLAIAPRAVSAHGGEIQVDNRPGEGVTFTICLPRSKVIQAGERHESVR